MVRRLVHADEPPAPTPDEQLVGAPLFEAVSPCHPKGDTAPWPQSLPATAENRVLPLKGTIEAAYASWRASEDGERVYRAIERAALEAVAAGARRLSINALFELVRARLKLPTNNTYRAPLVRDLCEEIPALRPYFQLRQRKAS